MSKTTDDRLSFRPYRLAVERVWIRFDLIRFSLQVLKERDQKNFFTNVSDEKIAKIEKFRVRAKQHKFFPDEEVDRIADEQIESIKSVLRRERRSGNLRFTAEFTEDRINQSELLLLVAHFESFMKLVHEKFLLAAPGKVFGKGFRDEQNPRIPIREIFDTSEGWWNSQKFLNELVAKEVKWLDAQSIETKSDYFAKNFGIMFGDASDIAELKSIMKRRNEISHEVYAPPNNGDEVLKKTLGEGKEPPLVPSPMLKQARQLFESIPRTCIEYGGKTYQSFFKKY